MTYFGPTRAEMKFRLFLSAFGLALIGGAVALRGFPSDGFLTQLLIVAAAFFAASTWVSYSKLRKFEDEE